MKKSTVPVIILFNILLLSPLFSQPKDADYFITYGGMAVVLSSQLFQDYLSPAQPGWTETNRFDLFFRDKLKWSDPNIHIAHKLSNVLLWGFLIPATFWAPELGDYKYNEHLLLNMEVLAVAGFLVASTKFITGRQRPYAHFHIKTDADPSEDNISFFSGHSTLTFAAATSTSMMLQDKYHSNSGWLWGSTLTLAALTGYLRIAADRHYMSDVLTGAVIGTLTAYLITKNQKRNYFESRKSKLNVLFAWSIPL